MDNIIIEKTIEYVKEFFKNDFSGHDYYHSLRVYQNAVRISEIENAIRKLFPSQLCFMMSMTINCHLKQLVI